MIDKGDRQIVKNSKPIFVVKFTLLILSITFILTDNTYIYLHGFASSPRSNKASYLRDRFAEVGLELIVLDLNQGDFSKLTLTRQIEHTIDALPDSETPVVLIGSSFGGLTCAWVAEKKRQVKKMILLAPAFGFPQSWYSKLQPEQIEKWRRSGYLSVYHYGQKRSIPLHYEFLRDADNYPVSKLKRSLPTLIIHGIRDDVVPIEVSHNYVKKHPQARLIELDSDHGLNDVKQRIWQETQIFLKL